MEATDCSIEYFPVSQFVIPLLALFKIFESMMYVLLIV